MSLLKKILVGMTIIVISLFSFSCTKEENSIVTYEQFEYDYPDNYVDFPVEPKLSYNLSSEEEYLVEKIINIESPLEQENMILELLGEDIVNLTFKDVLLSQRFNIYNEVGAELMVLEITDELLSEIVSLYDYM